MPLTPCVPCRKPAFWPTALFFPVQYSPKEKSKQQQQQQHKNNNNNKDYESCFSDEHGANFFPLNIYGLIPRLSGRPCYWHFRWYLDSLTEYFLAIERCLTWVGRTLGGQALFCFGAQTEAKSVNRYTYSSSLTEERTKIFFLFLAGDCNAFPFVPQTRGECAEEQAVSISVPSLAVETRSKPWKSTVCWQIPSESVSLAFSFSSEKLVFPSSFSFRPCCQQSIHNHEEETRIFPHSSQISCFLICFKSVRRRFKWHTEDKIANAASAWSLCVPSLRRSSKDASEFLAQQFFT